MFENGVIYIPAYNAAATLPTVFSRISKSLIKQVSEILVVDNNSDDSTSQTALAIGKDNNLTNLLVIRNPENLGYGGSQKLAYQRCIDKGYKYVAMLHGDAQYAPELLESLIGPVVEGKADMIFGSRIQGNPLAGGMPLHRYLGNRVLTFIQNFVLGIHLSEFHSGYRVYSVEALKQIPFNRLSSDYHFDTEIIILLLQYGKKISERPIPTHYGTEKNYVNIWRYGTDVLVTTITYYFHRMGLRHSKRWALILGA